VSGRAGVGPVDARLVEAVRGQHRAFVRGKAVGGGDPLYARLLEVVLADTETGGPCADVLRRVDPALDAVDDAVVLRFLGGVHRLVLTGRARELAPWFPTVGGTAPPDGVDDVFRHAVEAHHDDLVAALAEPVQTNEVGRCAPLLVGFQAAVRAATADGAVGASDRPPPVRLLEIGSSAGLNLRFDRFRYEGGAEGTTFGPRDASVRFVDAYEDPRPRLDQPVDVVERGGCDRHPIDAASEHGRLLLRSFVWPSQTARHRLLDGALDVAAAVPVPVDRADAGEWLEHQLLDDQRPDLLTIVFHSIVWQYLGDGTRTRIVAALDACPTPRAWVRFEPFDPARWPEVRVTSWPAAGAEGREEVVATSGYHGHGVRARTPPP
jgi:hypothetical protein